MPKRNFSLAEGEPPRLTLSWRGIWKDMQVTLDDQLLGTIPDGKALKEGRTFTMPDGGRLDVRLKTGLQTELQVLRNSQPLPGSGSDPQSRLNVARAILWVIGGINVIAGVVALASESRALAEMGISWHGLIAGVIYGVLGYFVGRRSTVALTIAVILFALDTIAVFYLIVGSGGRVGIGAAWRIIFFFPLLQGFGAIKALKARDATRKSAEVF